MTAKIVKLEPVEILEGAKGQEFTNLAILGTLPDGSIWVTGNSNAGEILVMMEMAKHQLLFSE